MLILLNSMLFYEEKEKKSKYKMKYKSYIKVFKQCKIFLLFSSLVFFFQFQSNLIIKFT